MDRTETQIIRERDEAINAFDRVCALLGVETEYSNNRGYEEIFRDLRDVYRAAKEGK